MKKVLFVCTGNTCRSCMAETIFNHLCDVENLQAVSSGVAVINNSKTSKNSATVVRENINLDISDRKAVQITKEMIEDSDIILTMTMPMRDALVSSLPQFSNKVYTLNQYVGVSGDIVDPFGEGIEVYRQTYKQLKNSILLLLNKLKKM